MAEVYKGRIQGPAGFERTFVVKRILPHLSDDATFIKMFVEEGEVLRRASPTPNIVHIFELGAAFPSTASTSSRWSSILPWTTTSPGDDARA